MKDLYVLAADADMEAVFRAILARPDSLGIRPISFEIKLYWEHDASSTTSSSRSITTAAGATIVPRIASASSRIGWIHARSQSCSRLVVIAPELDTIPDPKERLRQVFVRSRKRQPRPQDFEQIASQADLDAWNPSPGFRILKETLQNWFPTT